MAQLVSYGLPQQADVLALRKHDQIAPGNAGGAYSCHALLCFAQHYLQIGPQPYNVGNARHHVSVNALALNALHPAQHSPLDVGRLHVEVLDRTPRRVHLLHRVGVLGHLPGRYVCIHIIRNPCRAADIIVGRSLSLRILILSRVCTPGNNCPLDALKFSLRLLSGQCAVSSHLLRAVALSYGVAVLPQLHDPQIVALRRGLTLSRCHVISTALAGERSPLNILHHGSAHSAALSVGADSLVKGHALGHLHRVTKEYTRPLVGGVSCAYALFVGKPVGGSVIFGNVAHLVRKGHILRKGFCRTLADSRQLGRLGLYRPGALHSRHIALYLTKINSGRVRLLVGGQLVALQRGLKARQIGRHTLAVLVDLKGVNDLVCVAHHRVGVAVVNGALAYLISCAG